MADINIQSLKKSYGALDALKEITLHVHDGELLVLVGPSGCGKSTLLGLIAGLDRPTSGRIMVGTKDVTFRHPRDRDIAMVFQSYALYPTMTVRKNISFGLEMRGVEKSERERAVVRVAELLQITPLLERKPGQLSGGQRQRVAMGRALVRDPEAFLMDEPLSNLDAKLRVDMRAEIKKLHMRLGKTMIYVTHDQVEAMTLADRIAVMKGGVIQQLAAPRALYEDPENRFVAEFIGSPAMNFLTAEIAGGAHSTLTFDEALDQSIRVPGLEGFARHNSKILVGLRPEDLRIVTPSEPVERGAVSLRAVVDIVEPTGAEDLVSLKIGKASASCKMRDGSALSPGDNVDLAIPLDKLRFFDVETEARVRLSDGRQGQRSVA